jgi:hypothetical protein
MAIMLPPTSIQRLILFGAPSKMPRPAYVLSRFFFHRACAAWTATFNPPKPPERHGGRILLALWFSRPIFARISCNINNELCKLDWGRAAAFLSGQA